jgi:hypothetical protein
MIPVRRRHQRRSDQDSNADETADQSEPDNWGWARGHSGDPAQERDVNRDGGDEQRSQTSGNPFFGQSDAAISAQQ